MGGALTRLPPPLEASVRPQTSHCGSGRTELTKCRVCPSLQCLYCEKTFRDKTALRDHMRKRRHRRVNPKNRAYDRFYVINYLVSLSPHNMKHGASHGPKPVGAVRSGSPWGAQRPKAWGALPPRPALKC